MVWGGISLKGRTDLHVIASGTLIAVRYKDEIWLSQGSLHQDISLGAVSPGFLLVQDNAHFHVARVNRQFLDEEGIDAIG